MTFTIFPIRLLGVLVCFLFAWIFATLGLAGLNAQKMKEEPITRWRSVFRSCMLLSLRLLFSMSGFYWVKIKGKQVKSNVAPILVIAPHTSYCDFLLFSVLGGPSATPKTQLGNVPFSGKIIDFTQPLYVEREDPNSRQNFVTETVKRAQSKGLWRQILMFPEGTCTNGSCILPFKPGAFIPGVPVQPVCVRYPNPLDTYSYCWLGPSQWYLYFLTLTQFYNRFEVEFLPVYYPTDEEKHDPKLYASNVRNVMANALNLPLTDYVYEDTRILMKVNALDFAGDLCKIQLLRENESITETEAECNFIKRWLSDQMLWGEVLNKATVAQMMELEQNNSTVDRIFNILDKNKTGTIDAHLYAVILAWHGRSAVLASVLAKLFNGINCSKESFITIQDFQQMMKCTNYTKDDCVKLFHQLDNKLNGKVTQEMFTSLIRLKPEYLKLFTYCCKTIHDEGYLALKKME